MLMLYVDACMLNGFLGFDSYQYKHNLIINLLCIHF